MNIADIYKKLESKYTVEQLLQLKEQILPLSPQARAAKLSELAGEPISVEEAEQFYLAGLSALEKYVKSDNLGIDGGACGTGGGGGGGGC